MVSIAQKLRGTLREEKCTLFEVSQISLKGFSWKCKYGTQHTFSKNNVSLVAIGQ
jgi:hypothetical protein